MALIASVTVFQQRGADGGGGGGFGEAEVLAEGAIQFGDLGNYNSV